MKKIVFIFLSLFIFIGTVNAEELKSVSLYKCVDGDTAEFIVDGEIQKFRFLAIDTPESVHPTKEVEAYGKEASEYTCERLTNGNIEIEYDEKGGPTDKYGRGLAWIYVDGSLLQEELVSRGYAEVAYVYYKYSKVPALCDIQRIAKDNNKGIWSGNRKEGYCSTGSNAKVEETATKKTTTKVSDKEKVLKYIEQGKYDKALTLLIKNTNNIYLIIFLSILLILAIVYKYKNKRKKR